MFKLHIHSYQVISTIHFSFLTSCIIVYTVRIYTGNRLLVCKYVLSFERTSFNQNPHNHFHIGFHSWYIRKLTYILYVYHSVIWASLRKPHARELVMPVSSSPKLLWKQMKLMVCVLLRVYKNIHFKARQFINASIQVQLSHKEPE